MKKSTRLALFRWVQNHKESFIVSFIYRLCGFFRLAYYNSSNHDLDENGERRIIEKCLNYFTIDGVQLVFFDVGANVGDWSILVKKLNDNVILHCFEIVESTYVELNRKLNGYSHVYVTNIGLAGQEGKVVVKHYPKSSSGSSIYDLPWMQEYDFVEAKVITGDDYLEKREMVKVHFLKIDVEGADFDVLKGFKEALKLGKIDVIQFEYGKGAIISKTMLYDFYKYLEGYNYIIGRIYMDYVDFSPYNLFEDDNLLQSNFIGVRKYHEMLISQLTR